MIGGEGVILAKLQPDQVAIAAKENHARTFVGHGKEIPAWIEFPLKDATGVIAMTSMVRDAYENALNDGGSS